ncbi:LexA family transcriptional regulator [Fulvivirga sp. M361]|uniref:XRE family transcriptional regulator n=1 Tax=Fulvivirga sp. M361 TaxID=2594266 RepID=UPI00117B0E01|nr:LexA family transcriptional regulator [Fulvivirga sp. M361]TRX50669.1 LexA family transcriptional regulator [Fulvivirga sp. M361]
MSQIGKNIKRIRSAKKLNQSQFAEIFGLTRGSVGAYEEGRAEPKIDTIIQIANNFSLSIDLLLNKELTVNDLFHFDVLHQKLDEAHHFQKPATQAFRKGGIGLVSLENQLEYIVNHTNKDFISHLPYIELPINFKGTTRAFELNGSEMEYNQNGLHHGDILLCLQTVKTKTKTKPGDVYVIVHKEGIITRRLKSAAKSGMNFISDDPNYADIEFATDDILELWNVKGAYSTYLNPPKMIENRVMLLENRLNELEKKIKS